MVIFLEGELILIMEIFLDLGFLLDRVYCGGCGGRLVNLRLIILNLLLVFFVFMMVMM